MIAKGKDRGENEQCNEGGMSEQLDLAWRTSE